MLASVHPRHGAAIGAMAICLLALAACTPSASDDPGPDAGASRPLDELWPLEGIPIRMVDDRYSFDAPTDCTELAARLEAGPWRAVPILLPTEVSGIDDETGESFTTDLDLALLAIEGPERSALLTGVDGPGLCATDLVFSTDTALTVSGTLQYAGTARNLPFMCTPVLGTEDETAVAVFLDAPGIHLLLNVDVVAVRGAQDLTGSETRVRAVTGDRSMASTLAGTMRDVLLGTDDDAPGAGEFVFGSDTRGTVTLDGRKPIRGHLEAEGLEDVTGAHLDVSADFRC
jgi:hypothetical protein